MLTCVFPPLKPVQVIPCLDPGNGRCPLGQILIFHRHGIILHQFYVPWYRSAPTLLFHQSRRLQSIIHLGIVGLKRGAILWQVSPRLRS